jgi:hypothetical protein
MASEPTTFRNHFVSLYQSAVDELARNKLPALGLASRPGLANGLVRAAAQIGALRMQGAGTIPSAAPANVSQTVWTCAKLGFELMEARVRGDTSRATQLVSELEFNVCDVDWAETIAHYVGYFGPGGGRAKIPYVTAAQVGDRVLELKPGATVALIGDWGTGTSAAVALLEEVARQKPDVLIHLGDIYYSGTPDECDRNFQRIVDQVLGRPATPVAVYTLAGNHDMYSGGAGYYGLLKTLNPPPLQQPASFFCLRSADASWQFVAMDTGKHDYNPFTVTEVLTFLEEEEEAWIAARIAEFPGKTILLSHHPLFSAFSQIGPANPDGSLNACNPRLEASFARFSRAAPGRIAAWFWGHEHNLCIYEAYRGLAPGRCIGHGAVPVFIDGSPAPAAGRIVDPPKLKQVRLDADDHVFMHGFTIVRFTADASAAAEYYEDRDGGTPIYAEAL